MLGGYEVERVVTTSTPLDLVWPHLADFTTVTGWDPNTPDCRLVEGEGGVGSVYAVTSVFRGRETHLEYTVTTFVERERLVLRGENRTVTAVEDMTFTVPPDGGTRVAYRADFTFHGPARLAVPFLTGKLDGIADDAQRGLTRDLARIGGTVAPDTAVADFEVRSEWKETVHYIEGDRRMTFDAAWGVTPHVLYVPSAEIWDDVVPLWLVGRRPEVVARLREHSGHTLTDTTTGYARRT